MRCCHLTAWEGRDVLPRCSLLSQSQQHLVRHGDESQRQRASSSAVPSIGCREILPISKNTNNFTEMNVNYNWAAHLDGLAAAVRVLLSPESGPRS